jgi:HEAT repeat protein
MTPLVLLLLAFALQTSTQAGNTGSDSAEPAESADSAWTELNKGLADKSSDRRTKATRALGLLLNDTKAQQAAEKELKDDPSADVRAAAAVALGDMNAASSQDKLKAALQDKDLKVVISSANALYTFKNPAAYDIYYTLLTGERKGPGMVESELHTLRDRKQVEELAFQAGLGFVPFGGMGYQAWKTITKDDASTIRAAAAEKLANDPDPKTTEALGHACRDGKWKIRMAVVEAIAKRGDAKLLPSVGPLLYDGNDDVRFEAAAAIIRLSKPPAPPARPTRPAKKGSK